MDGALTNNFIYSKTNKPLFSILFMLAVFYTSFLMIIKYRKIHLAVFLILHICVYSEYVKEQPFINVFLLAKQIMNEYTLFCKVCVIAFSTVSFEWYPLSEIGREVRWDMLENPDPSAWKVSMFPLLQMGIGVKWGIGLGSFSDGLCKMVIQKFGYLSSGES